MTFNRVKLGCAVTSVKYLVSAVSNPECIFENFEIGRVKQGQFLNF